MEIKYLPFGMKFQMEKMHSKQRMWGVGEVSEGKQLLPSCGRGRRDLTTTGAGAALSSCTGFQGLLRHMSFPLALAPHSVPGPRMTPGPFRVSPLQSICLLLVP